jgi:hypothetical protein
MARRKRRFKTAPSGNVWLVFTNIPFVLTSRGPVGDILGAAFVINRDVFDAVNAGRHADVISFEL